MELNKLIRYYPVAINLAGRFLSDKRDAEEAVQNAFLRAINNSESFRGDSDITSWFYRIVINESIRKFRTGKKKRWILNNTSPNLDSITFENPLTSILEKERKEDYDRKFRIFLDELARLDHSYGEVMRRVSRGQSYNQIASEMELELGTVKSRVNRGKKELRRKVREKYYCKV